MTLSIDAWQHIVRVKTAYPIIKPYTVSELLETMESYRYRSISHDRSLRLRRHRLYAVNVAYAQKHGQGLIEIVGGSADSTDSIAITMSINTVRAGRG